MSTLHDEFEVLDHDDFDAAEEQEEIAKLEQLRKEKERAEEEARLWWEEALKAAAYDAEPEQRKNYDTLMNEAVAKKSVADKASLAYEAQAKIVADLKKKHQEEKEFAAQKQKIADELPYKEDIEAEERRREEETEKIPTLEEIEEGKKVNKRLLDEETEKIPTLEEIEEGKRVNERLLEEEKEFAAQKQKIADELPYKEDIEAEERRREEEDALQRSNAMTEDELVDIKSEEKADEKESDEKAASEKTSEEASYKIVDPDEGLSQSDKEEKYQEINHSMEPIILEQFKKIKALYMDEDEKTGLAQNFKAFEESKDKHGSAEFKEMYDALSGLDPKKSIQDMYFDVLGPKHDYSQLETLRQKISKAYEKTQNYVAMKDSTKTKWSLGKGKTYLKEAQEALQKLGDMCDCIDTITVNRKKLQDVADYKYSIPERTGISLKDLEKEEVITKEYRKEETHRVTKERQKGTNKKKPVDKKKQSQAAKEPPKKGK